MLVLSQKLSKSDLHEGVGKHSGNFRTSLLAAMILHMKEDLFGLFMFEKARRELTKQS